MTAVHKNVVILLVNLCSFTGTQRRQQACKEKLHINTFYKYFKPLTSKSTMSNQLGQNKNKKRECLVFSCSVPLWKSHTWKPHVNAQHVIISPVVAVHMQNWTTCWFSRGDLHTWLCNMWEIHVNCKQVIILLYSYFHMKDDYNMYP